MASRRVFILWTNPLFHESVRMLLDHPEIECVGETNDYTASYEEILTPRPDTILVEEINGNIPLEIMQVLETSQWVVKVVGLNLWDNQLISYLRVQQTIGTVEDLVHTILSDP
jgi:DNA-binding NarL/FixJ family response regulator